MFGEDDEDSSVPVTSAPRYPCMPSLIAMQQMKNRLHLANTGKKLMKWTTRATEKELRIMSADLISVTESMESELRDAFILLARSRFYFPEVNCQVLENVEREAALKVYRTFRFVAGVKIVQIHVLEIYPDTYTHLGLGQGGHTILETKNAFRDFLKRLIWIVELKAGFRDVEDAYKKASKKQHVLERIVIPRSKATVSYIVEQMDEMRREEFFRIKKILAVKKREIDLKKQKLAKKNVPELDIEKLLEHVMSTEVQTIDLGSIDKDPSICLSCGDQDFKSEEQVTCLCHDDQDSRSQVRIQSVEDRDWITSELSAIADSMQKCVCSTTNSKTKVIDNYSIAHILELLQTDSINTQTSVETLNSRNVKGSQLGIFEVEHIETTKIIRVKNKDGTVDERVKVIRKNIERRTPNINDGLERVTQTISNDSNNSRSRSKAKKETGFKTVGVLTVKNYKCWQNLRKVKSDNLSPSISMTQSVKLRLSTESVNLSNYAACSNCFSCDSLQSVIENAHKSLPNTSSHLENIVHLHDVSENCQYIMTEDSSINTSISYNTGNSSCTDSNVNVIKLSSDHNNRLTH